MKQIKKLGLLCILLLLWRAGVVVEAEEKQTIYNSPYVTFSPDGLAWTTNAGDTDYEQYINPYKDITVTTDLVSSLRALRVGEHYYTVKRQGEIPLGKWVVEYERTSCVHDAYPASGYFHGLSYGTQKCSNKYYSGWRAYCADCGERVTDVYAYMSMEAAKSIDYLELSSELDYYYLCPHCTNLEQGSSMKEHNCKAISLNQYKVMYDANSGFASYGGYMEDSIHMYNNAKEYEGKSIQAATHLNLNAYTRIGYEFVGWNTAADGSGKHYEDGAEIFNLCKADWNESEEGIVVLYAQWRPSKSTLETDPMGGTYLGKDGIAVIIRNYGSTYTTNSAKIKPPSGYTLTFETNGGSEAAPITGTQSFKEWVQKPEFRGRMVGEKYFFLAPDGNRDRLEATYSRNPVILPNTTRSGRSFGGWYEDAACTEYVGGAGTEIVPQKDMTLYALWVDLKLEAENNMTANEGKGAVDLFWSQADGKNKAYLLYQQKENAKQWLQIHSSEDIGKLSGVTETFLYTGEKKTYVVPYTGLYTLTASGAQGGNFGAYAGGYGGRTTAKVWLVAGEELHYNVGGQNGYNCGGTGAVYGSNGGGRTSVYSNRQGTLLIAGGGGGASVNGNGGMGGSSASLGNAGEYGESGQAGGGGGFVGGKAGEVLLHEHEETCYLDHVMLETTSNTTLIDGNKSYYTDSWLSLFQNTYGTFASATGDCYSVTAGLNSLRATTRNTNRFLVMEYGRISNPNAETTDATTWYTTPTLSPVYPEGYIPVDGNKEVTIDVLLNGMHEDASGAIDESQTYLKVCNQDGEQLFLKLCSNVTRTTISRNEILNLDTSTTCKYTENGNTEAVRFVETISLPEGTESIYFTAQIMHGALDCWMEIDVNKISFSGGKNNPVICGYEEKQVLSSKPAYGGSNYINKDAVSSYVDEMGVKTGNGMFTLQSVCIGFLDEMELEGVIALDKAAPDRISETVEKIAMEEDTLKLIWEEPEDNGTLYKHKAESYEIGAETLLCTSNITENVLKSGIKGYYYRLDENSSTVVTEKNGLWRTDHSMIAVLTDYVQYVHVAAVDIAGNVGATLHIPIGSKTKVSDEQIVKWTLDTEQLELAEGENVYPATDEYTYYVRSDGKTPFTLYYKAGMQGPASVRYQPNYIIYESRMEEKAIQNSFFVGTDTIQAGTLTIDPDRLQYAVNGASLLERYPYSIVKRFEYNRGISAEQKFTLKTGASGKKIQLFPRVGAETEEETIYSPVEKDMQNGITIIGDGEAPIITGLDVLENSEILHLDSGSVYLQVSAYDTLSGVRELVLSVNNTDNKSKKVYKQENGDSIQLVINRNETVFQGNFTLTVYTVDNVGNEYSESYGGAEFALEASVERILEPHEPIFKGGESGVLKITTMGYAETVEIVFPEELLLLNPELNTVWDYTANSQYVQQEQLQFMIPLYAPVNENYTITVRAYKGGQVVDAYPVFSVVDTGGSILEEVRTRLR